MIFWNGMASCGSNGNRIHPKYRRHKRHEFNAWFEKIP